MCKAKRSFWNWNLPNTELVASLRPWNSLLFAYRVKPFCIPDRETETQGRTETLPKPHGTHTSWLPSWELPPRHPSALCQVGKSLRRQPGKGAYQLVWESDKHMKNDPEKKPRHFTRKITLPHNLKSFPIKSPGKASLRTHDMSGFLHRLRLSVFTWGKVLCFST